MNYVSVAIERYNELLGIEQELNSLKSKCSESKLSTLKQARREMISRAMRKHKNNKTRAAAELGIGIRTLQRWLIKNKETL